MLGDSADKPQAKKEAPQALPEALALLHQGASQGQAWHIVAGGTASDTTRAPCLHLTGIDSLRQVTEWESSLSLGPLLTASVLRQEPLVEELAPLLHLWANWPSPLAAQVTLGGALEVPCAATRAVLLAWGGSVILAATEGARELDWEALWSGHKPRLPEELFLRISVPSRPWAVVALERRRESAAAAWAHRGEVAVAVAEGAQQRRLRGLELVLMRRMAQDPGSVIDVAGLTGEYHLNGDTAEAVGAVLRRLTSRLATV